MTGPAVLGWAFLVARGRQLGYQLLLAPDFLTTGPDSALLMAEIRGEVPGQGPPVVTELAGPASGPVAVVYRTLRATTQDLGAAERPAEPLLDRAGRPLVLSYGFVCRGGRVSAPDEDDLRIARDAALATYRRFLGAEEMFRTRASHPYTLRSAVVPATRPPAGTAPARTAPAGMAPAGMAPPGIAGAEPAAWTAQALPGAGGRPAERPAVAARRRPAVVIALIAVLALAGLASGAYVFTRAQRPAVQVQDQRVRVPDVTGQAAAAAARQLRRAGLVPKIELAASDGPAGFVVATTPRAGTRVRSHSPVQVQVSAGGAARPGAAGGSGGG